MAKGKLLSDEEHRKAREQFGQSFRLKWAPKRSANCFAAST